MKRTVKFIAVAGLLSVSACSGMNGFSNLKSSEHGAFQITADKEGMRAFSDALTGAIVTGKASPDTLDAHNQLRQEQEKQTTTRQAYKSLPSTNPFARFLSGNKGGN